MGGEFSVLLKRLVALGTLEWSFPRMGAKVPGKAVTLRKYLLALDAIERFLLGVRTDMHSAVIFYKFS
jgi:hypothetical protein